MIPAARKLILIFYMNQRIISTQIRQDSLIKERNAQNQLSRSLEKGLVGTKASRVLCLATLCKYNVETNINSSVV